MPLKLNIASHDSALIGPSFYHSQCFLYALRPETSEAHQGVENLKEETTLVRSCWEFAAELRRSAASAMSMTPPLQSWGPAPGPF